MLTGSPSRCFCAPVPSWAFILVLGVTAARAQQPSAGDADTGVSPTLRGSAMAADEQLKPLRPPGAGGGNVSAMDACCTWPFVCGSCSPYDKCSGSWGCSACDCECCNPTTAPIPAPAPPTSAPTESSWCPNWNGWLTGMDIDDMDTTLWSSARANLTHHESVRQALGQIAEWFPEYGEFIAQNGPLLEHVIETGEEAPADAPVPPAFLEKRETTPKALNMSGQDIQPEAIEDCVPEIAILGYQVLKFVQVLMTNTETPSVLTVDLVRRTIDDMMTNKLWTTGKKRALKKSALAFQNAFSTGDIMSAAKAIWHIFASVYTCDTMRTLAHQMLYNMDFWGWMRLVGGLVTKIGTVVLGGWPAFAAQAALGVLKAYGVYNSAVGVVEHCQDY